MAPLRGSALHRRIRRIRMLVLDVDGVLTDGKMIYGPDGEEYKNFNVKDGTGIRLLQRAGIGIAWITGEDSAAMKARASRLDIMDVHSGVLDKAKALDELQARRRFSDAEFAFMGDDIGDLPVLRRAGFSVAVRDAVPAVRKSAHYVTRLKGGEGAVREVCDLLLSVRRD